MLGTAFVAQIQGARISMRKHNQARDDLVRKAKAVEAEFITGNITAKDVLIQVAGTSHTQQYILFTNKLSILMF